MNTYKILNKTLGAVALSILFSTNAIAQEQAAKDMKVLNKEIKKKGNKVNVYMDLNLDVKATRVSSLHLFYIRVRIRSNSRLWR